ncbi:MAG: hypothetical protein SCJ94_12105, partial [Bacillota bacterium]|nr:hypothetical protein [Bacillota bacterium]
MKGRKEFTKDEIEKIRQLLRIKVQSNKQQQTHIRNKMRKNYSFYISDFEKTSKAFDEDQLDNLIKQGVIQIKDLNVTAEKVYKVDKPDDLLSTNREPVETTVFIGEDSTGYSYKNLFYPYLKNAKTIIIK